MGQHVQHAKEVCWFCALLTCNLRVLCPDTQAFTTVIILAMLLVSGRMVTTG
jgi:hypothetical protein